MISIAELVRIIRKYLLAAIAAAFLTAVCTFVVVRTVRKYNCTLNFKYNYPGAEQGLAPDGESELDPYELQNPAVIHAALEKMGITKDEDTTIENIRNNISIRKIVTSQDQEVAESAAVLGEKYEVTTTEYQLTFTYKSSLGEDYGKMICDGLIRAYDDYIVENYYSKTVIPDFMQNISEMNVDYMDMADIIRANLDDIVASLEDYAAWYPDFRSKRTGYSFAELAELYQNVENNLYARFEGNIRVGNLTRDRELAIKNYTTIVKNLLVSEETNQAIADSYRLQIRTFYDSYKEAGLYRQASSTQVSQNSSNNRDQEILRDFEAQFDKLINTYDDIVLSYTQTAAKASDARRDREYYLDIIRSLEQDRVSQEKKQLLLEKNAGLLETMTQMTGEYCTAANASINELFDQKVAGDIQYLISTDISSSMSTMTSMVFAAVLAGALVMMGALAYEVVCKSIPEGSGTRAGNSRLIPNDKEHEAAYQQYKAGFPEFYVVYQKMKCCHEGLPPRFEAFVRWKSRELGHVSPGMILQYFGDMNLIMELNDWIVGTVCRDIPRMTKALGVTPTIHINCMFSEVADFGMNSILRKNSREWGIDASALCVEMDGSDIMTCMDEIILLEKMGYQVCVDHFEDKSQGDEILSVFKPDYVKVSGSIFQMEEMSTSLEDLEKADQKTRGYLAEISSRCRSNGIGLCVSGIENDEQDALLDSAAVDYKQGFYYGYPLGIEDLLDEETPE
ncbi:MAG: EAL domain-containing protein [Dysosmobacter sp.]|nr:EAL domain-containing protein [Dysosmobacter sp.]MDY3866264.1 EAL domain-containing protein [Dysosmobacter sp.]